MINELAIRELIQENLDRSIDHTMELCPQFWDPRPDLATGKGHTIIIGTGIGSTGEFSALLECSFPDGAARIKEVPLGITMPDQPGVH